MASAPTEVLASFVERVTFHSEENGVCVLRIKARGQGDLITILGHATMIGWPVCSNVKIETINLPGRC